KSFVVRQEELLDREIAKLNLRIGDCRKTSDLAVQLKKKGVTPAAILKEIQEKVPYQLNNQKPMAELFRETPDENWTWEMEVGSQKRAARIFEPIKELLLHIRGQIVTLKGKAQV
ncbi:MAG: hypothetical protein AAB242_07660, partial [Nitrospirota bacterium]